MLPGPGLGAGDFPAGCRPCTPELYHALLARYVKGQCQVRQKSNSGYNVSEDTAMQSSLLG